MLNEGEAGAYDEMRKWTVFGHEGMSQDANKNEKTRGSICEFKYGRNGFICEYKNPCLGSFGKEKTLNHMALILHIQFKYATVVLITSDSEENDRTWGSEDELGISCLLY
jgi:hypothetical protein